MPHSATKECTANLEPLRYHPQAALFGSGYGFSKRDDMGGIAADL
jgi:hypothetical protein